MNFEPTDLPPGSPQKIALMRKRDDAGLEVFHPGDRSDWSGLTGAAMTNKARKSSRIGAVGIVAIGLGVIRGRKMLSE